MAALGGIRGARAQAPVAGARIGWISYSMPGTTLDTFQEGMHALGYVGRSAVSVELRVVEPNPDRVRTAVEDLQKMPVALIVCQAGAAPVVHRISAGRIPLVFAYSGDPVAAGMVESFARPGGNTTGMSFLSLELVGKRLEVMKEIAPALRRVAILANPQHPGEKAELNASLEAAGRLGVQASYFQLMPGANPDSVFDRIRRERVEGIVVFPDNTMVARATQIAEFALRERLLSVSGWALFAYAGFIATYGPNLKDAYLRLAAYADRLLKGARADTLPVELPARFELAVNLKTAKALGIATPQSLLLRADEVIQ
ncbi:MAG: ABC transporter substrate-binding protein [Betaproteobacteria bacterium]